MSRYLFVVPPLVGHVNPAAGVAAELRRRGHDVAWVAHEPVVGPLLGPRPVVYPAGERFLSDIVAHLPERDRRRGPAALQFLWDRVLVPLALDMAEPVRAAVDDFRPDLLVSDQQAFAGAIVAAERGLPWAVSATTSADLAALPVGLPKIGEWMERRIHRLCRDLGHPELPAAGFDPRDSPYLVLRYSTPALSGEPAEPSAAAFVGPVLRRPPEPGQFPWAWLDRHDTNVFVSLGTVSQTIGERFLRTVLDAVAGQDYGAIVVGPDGLAEDAPGNVLVRSFVPQPQLLPRVDAVVCHAGHNTTVEALACGLPLVCAPIRDDQPVTADLVVRAGAGVRIGFGRARPAGVAAAIATVLDDPSYRTAAAGIARSFAAAGGAAAAADRLDALTSTAGSGRQP